LPVVVSCAAFCGIADFLSHAVNAYVLQDPRDVGALVRALIAVLPPAPAAATLGVAGQAFARAHLWSAQARQQEALYLRVVAASSRA
jgi:UDP-glucose:(heptosyl)LPS alpha-1,3-glucosyltransferase